MRWVLQARRALFLVSSLAAAAMLAACGGGNDGDTAPASTLTPTQKAVEQSFLEGSNLIVTSLPMSGTPTPGTHYAYARRYALPASLSDSPQRLTINNDPLTNALSIPDLSRIQPNWVLKAGQLKALSSVSRGEHLTLALAAGSVVMQTRTEDGGPGVAMRFTSMQVLPLSGAFQSAPAEVQSWPPFAALAANPLLLKANPTFLPGAAYYRRTTVTHGDALYLESCGGGASASTLTSPPGACTDGNTIEQVLAAVTQRLTGSPRTLADGQVRDIEGARVWISNTPRASNITAVRAYPALIQLGNAVHAARFEPDGTPMLTGLRDGTFVDYGLRFNDAAVQSLKAAAAQ